jgi:hypothetical protein
MDANFTPSRGLGQVAFSKFKITLSHQILDNHKKLVYSTGV